MELSILPGPDDTSELDFKAITLADQAKGFNIQKQPDYEAAAAFLKSVKGLAREISDFFAPLKKAAHDAHAKITAAEKEKLAPLVDAEAVVKRSMLAYSARVAEEQRIANECARIKAEEEARERQLAAAIAAETKGDTARAEQILARPTLTIVPPPPVETPRVAGISTRTAWRANVTNVMSFLAWIGENPAERAGFVKIDQSALDSLARAMKGAVQIPGVTFYADEVLAARAR